MPLSLNQLIKNLKNVDTEDILKSWKWKLSDIRDIVAISVIGDLYLLGKENDVYWLQVDNGELVHLTDSVKSFQESLINMETIESLFMPLLVEELIRSGKALKESEVYSQKVPSVLGGTYDIDNLEPTDMSVHFSFAGQIFEQIKDLPEGARVNINLKK